MLLSASFVGRPLFQTVFFLVILHAGRWMKLPYPIATTLSSRHYIAKIKGCLGGVNSPVPGFGSRLNNDEEYVERPSDSGRAQPRSVVNAPV